MTFIFWFTDKKWFLSFFFIRVNLIISQKIKNFFGKLLISKRDQTNRNIIHQNFFWFRHFEKFDFYHLPAHCAPATTVSPERAGTHMVWKQAQIPWIWRKPRDHCLPSFLCTSRKPPCTKLTTVPICPK